MDFLFTKPEPVTSAAIMRHLSDWLDYREGVIGLSSKTIDANRSDVGRFLRNLDGRELTRGEVATWIAKMRRAGVGGQAINRTVSSLKMFFDYLHKETGLHNHARDLPKMICDEPTRYTPSENDILRMMHACDCPRDRAMIALCAYAGLRRSEVVKLDLYDIQRADLLGACVVSIRHAKGNKSRVLPLCERATRVLRVHLDEAHYRENGPIFCQRHTRDRLDPDRVSEVVQKLVEELELNKGITPHALRRWFATTLYARKVETLDIADLMGHASVQTTINCYIKRDPNRLREMVKVLD